LTHEGLNIRAGLHTGPIIEEQSGELVGLAINIAQRIQSSADASQILISRCTRDLVHDGSYNFAHVKRTELKGVEGDEWDLYELILSE
jgi:class 3 adenylate cyclase